MLRANFSTFLNATFNTRIFFSIAKYPELPIYGSKNLTLAFWNLHKSSSYLAFKKTFRMSLYSQTLGCLANNLYSLSFCIERMQQTKSVAYPTIIQFLIKSLVDNKSPQRSGQRVGLLIQRSRVRIPPGIKIFLNFYFT